MQSKSKPVDKPAKTHSVHAMSINVHLYPSAFVNESRCFKITKVLAEGGFFSRILMLGVAREGLPDHEAMDAQRAIYRFPRLTGAGGMVAKMRGTLRWYGAIWKFLRNQDVACINCHSLPVLPLCVALKWKTHALLIYDTHELETETQEATGLRRPLAKLVEWLCMRWVDHTFCVSERIALWYHDRYAIAQPYVIRNIPDLSAAAPATAGNALRTRCALPSDALVFLYLGGLVRNRGIERTLALFAATPQDRHLVVIGDGSLRPLVESYAAAHVNIHYLPPVAYHEVVAMAAGADVGISVIDNTCLSHYYALSNKFFEYLQAGVPVLVGDLLEQQTIIRAHDAGWVIPTDDDAAIAMIAALTLDEVMQKKANAQAIRSQYSWQQERTRLLAAYTEILKVY